MPLPDSTTPDRWGPKTPEGGADATHRVAPTSSLCSTPTPTRPAIWQLVRW